MPTKVRWQTGLWLAVLALTLILTIKADVACLDWAAKLSLEGSPAPARDAGSPTGYALGQRHFLGTHERGETYRWIVATQELIASGPFRSAPYQADNVPLGRPQLMPKLYAAWLATISWALHVTSGEPIALSVERAALWEPIVSHALAFVGGVAFIGTRYGAASAAVAGLFFALFPPITGQFLPGVLTARTWALLLAAYAIALNLPSRGTGRNSPAFSARSALAAALALWLDPTLGFPAVLISAASGIGLLTTQGLKFPYLTWSLIGSGVTLAAWLIDQSPWSPAAGELRYVHPLYALAWFGIGLALDGSQRRRTSETRRLLSLVELVAAIPLVSALVYAQLKGGHEAWWYSSASLRRLTSLDETMVFDTALDWLAKSSLSEIVFVSAPALAATAALGLMWWRRRQNPPGDPPHVPLDATILFLGLLALAFFKVRWAVIVSLVSLPVVAGIAAAVSLSWTRRIVAGSAVFLFVLFAWARALPASLQRPSKDTPPGAADIEALVYRHCSHWIAAHNLGRNVAALAPPELSDSLVFHGGCRVLMSTAWETYPGQVAASRVLSAPEASEAEAVLQSREITHLILPSWDKVLPLLVRKSDAKDKDTLYERLQRWVYPPYLRPVPYRLPPTPGYLDQKLAVFKVTPPQDEALALSRLAEYFVEMDRAEPAGLVAKVLAESFPDDPNAAIARATVYAKTGSQSQFDRELTRLAANARADPLPFSWDRRVQRAIVFALGRQRDLARTEIEGCVATASDDALFELTPLQAYRLHTLATRLEVAFPNAHLADLLKRLGAEFSPASVSR